MEKLEDTKPDSVQKSSPNWSQYTLARRPHQLKKLTPLRAMLAIAAQREWQFIQNCILILVKKIPIVNLKQKCVH